MSVFAEQDDVCALSNLVSLDSSLHGALRQMDDHY